jgi:hypothetical protein
LVEDFLPVTVACLQWGVFDMPSGNALLPASYTNVVALVRKDSIIVLSYLILQDCIKWRGLLFHRFLVACADGDDDVAYLAKKLLLVRCKRNKLNYFPINLLNRSLY